MACPQEIVRAYAHAQANALFLLTFIACVVGVVEVATEATSSLYMDTVIVLFAFAFVSYTASIGLDIVYEHKRGGA